MEFSYQSPNEIQRYKNRNKHSETINSIKQKLNLLKELDNTTNNAIRYLSQHNLPQNLGTNLHLVNTLDELLQIFNLRSMVFEEAGYLKEFPDKIEGLNYDEYDNNSLHMAYKRNNDITGSTRIIIPTMQNPLLPTEKYIKDKFSLSPLKEKHNNKQIPIAELSRTVIDPNYRVTGNEFKRMFAGLYEIAQMTDIGSYLLMMTHNMYENLYSKCGMEILDIVNNRGNIDKACIILNWEPENSSEFFKKVFLRKNGRRLN